MPYTPIISPADLSSVLYAEVMNQVTRDNDTIAVEAIDTAVQEMKMYLHRYDMVKIFGDATLDVASVFSDTYIKRMAKDIAMWHLMQLANTTIDYEAAKNRYDEAIASLKLISAGKVSPQWPYQDTTGETAPTGRSVKIFTNTKRNNGY